MAIRSLIASSMLLIAGGIAWSVEAGDTATYYACAKPNGKVLQGTIRLNTQPKCRSNQALVFWNIEGPQGPPGAGLDLPQSCTEAETLTGIDAHGQIICSPVPEGPKVSFLASLSTDFPLSPVTVSNPFTTIPFDNVIHNDGGAYSNPAFVSPVAGVYHFHATLFVEQATRATLILVHKDAFGAAIREYAFFGHSTSDDWLRLSGGITIKLATSEAVEVILRNVNNPRFVIGEDGASGANSFFSGHLVYETEP